MALLQIVLLIVGSFRLIGDCSHYAIANVKPDLLSRLTLPAAWRGAFIQFQKRHPEVLVLDAFDAIKTLQCRETMLQPFDEGPIIVQVNPQWALWMPRQIMMIQHSYAI